MAEFFKIKDMNREWTTLKEYEDILFEFYNGIARITINRRRCVTLLRRVRCRR